MNIFLLVILSFFIGIFQYISYLKNDDISKTRQDQILTPEQNQLKLKLNCLKQQHANILNNYLLTAAYDGADSSNGGVVNLDDSTEECGDEINGGTNNIESKMICMDNSVKTDCAVVLCEKDTGGADLDTADKETCLNSRRDNPDRYKVYFVSSTPDEITSSDYSLLLDSGVGYYGDNAGSSSLYTPSGKVEIEGISGDLNENTPTMVYDISAFKIASVKRRCWNDLASVQSFCSENAEHPSCQAGDLSALICDETKEVSGTKACDTQMNISTNPPTNCANQTCREDNLQLCLNEDSSGVAEANKKYLKSFDIAKSCWTCSKKEELSVVTRCLGEQIRYSTNGEILDEGIDDLVAMTTCGTMENAKDSCRFNTNPRAKFPTWNASSHPSIEHERGYYYCDEKNPEEFGCSPCEVINSDWTGCENFYAEETSSTEWDSVGTTNIKEARNISTYNSSLNDSGAEDRGCSTSQCSVNEEAHMVWDGDSKVFKKFCCNVGTEFVCDDDDVSTCKCAKTCVTSGGDTLNPGEISGFETCPSSSNIRACLVSEVAGSGHIALTPGKDECPGGFFSKVYNPVLKCFYCLLPSPLPIGFNEEKGLWDKAKDFVKNIDFSLISSANAEGDVFAVDLSRQPLCLGQGNNEVNGVCSSPNTLNGSLRFDFLSSDYDEDSNSIAYKDYDISKSTTNNCRGEHAGCVTRGDDKSASGTYCSESGDCNSSDSESITYNTNKSYNNGFFEQPLFKAASNNLASECFLYCQDGVSCGLDSLAKGYVRIFKSFSSTNCSGILEDYQSGWSAAVPNWCPGITPRTGGVTTQNGLRLSAFADNSTQGPYMVQMEISGSGTQFLRWDMDGIWSTGDSYALDYLNNSEEMAYSETTANGDSCREFQIARPEEMSENEESGNQVARLKKADYGSNGSGSSANPFYSNFGVNDVYAERGFRVIGESEDTIEFKQGEMVGTENPGYIWDVDDIEPAPCTSGAPTEMSLKYPSVYGTMDYGITNSESLSTTYLVEKVRYRDINGDSAADWEYIPTKNCHFEVPKLYCSDNSFWASAPNLLGHGHAAGPTSTEEEKRAAKKVIVKEALKLLDDSDISSVDTSNLCPNGMVAVEDSGNDCVTCQINFSSNVNTIRSFVSSPDIDSCNAGGQSPNYDMCNGSQVLNSKGIIEMASSNIKDSANNTNSSYVSRLGDSDTPCPRACSNNKAIVYSTSGNGRFVCTAPTSIDTGICPNNYSRRVVKITKNFGSGDINVPAYLCTKDENVGHDGKDVLDFINVGLGGYCSSSYGESFSISTADFENEIDSNKQKSNSSLGCKSVYVDVDGNSYPMQGGLSKSELETENGPILEWNPTPVRSAFDNCMICI